MREKIAVMVASDASEVERVAALDLKVYLSEITEREVDIFDCSLDVNKIDAEKIFVIGTPETNPLLKSLTERKGVYISGSLLGEQGFLIKTISVEDRHFVLLVGCKGIGCLYAVYDFLENYCNVGFFPDGDRIPKKDNLTLGDIDCLKRPKVEYRIFLVHPYWTEPYAESCRLWSFDEWKRMIDWMKKKRYNILLLFHDEGTHLWGDAISRAFPEIKEDEPKLRKYAVMPKYRTHLNKQIIEYARKNGISVAYNFMYPQVPDFFKEDFPNLTYHEENMDSLSICASQKECSEIIERYWSKIIKTYGVDDSHLYIVCPYLHEKPLCNKFSTRAEPAFQAYQILKEIDSEANIFIESWCWKFDPKVKPEDEWKSFLKVMPSDVGIIDWDSRFNFSADGKEKFRWYSPRRWIQLVHITLEGAYPSSFVMLTPKNLIDTFKETIDHGAVGIAAFNIMTDGNEYLCNLAGELGWDPYLKEEDFLKKYVKLRFGEASFPTMFESFRNYLASIDEAVLMVGFSCYGPRYSAERALEINIIKGNKEMDWIKDRLSEFSMKYEYAKRALKLAEKERENQKGNILYDNYMWELKYILARWEEAINLYNSYRYSSDLTESEKYYNDALKAFYKVKDLYRDKRGYSMATTETLGKDVEYNPYFLENWDNYDVKGSFWKPHIARFHVVWERFREYEEYLKSLEPRKAKRRLEERKDEQVNSGCMQDDTE